MSDQKRIITPEHFKVAPEILGLPLASPSRRALAMAADLILITVLVKAGGAFLGIAAALLLFRASSRKQPGGSFIRQSVRFTLRIVGAIVLFVVILSGWSNLRDRITGKAAPDVEVTSDNSAADELNLNFSARDLPGLAGSLLALNRSDDSASVRAATTNILQTAKRSGATDRELRDARDDLIEMIGEDADSSEIRAVNAAVLEVAGTAPAVDTRVAELYVTALEKNDSATAALYRDSVKEVVAGSEIAALESRAARFEAQRDSLDRELEEARKAHGVRAFISGAADDLGVGFGWSAVFFTAFLAMWRGQTPGKRLAGVRVLRLDGKPLGWWIAFERFGGYAASLSVGLLGFAQILWDRNRQGLHDKACETVVVREVKPVR
jgi:uncharacterized RDD family membrane protein YckC